MSKNKGSKSRPTARTSKVEKTGKKPLNKLRWHWAPPDHPEYKRPCTITFIGRSTSPPRSKKQQSKRPEGGGRDSETEQNNDEE